MLKMTSRNVLRSPGTHGAAGHFAIALLSSGASAASVRLTRTKAKSEGGLFLTPLLSVVQDGAYDAFDVGRAPSAGVQFLAVEGGVGGVIDGIATFNAADGTSATTAVVTNPGGFGGSPVLDPGEVTTATLDLDTPDQRFSSFLSMVIPPKDKFIANDIR